MNWEVGWGDGCFAESPVEFLVHIIRYRGGQWCGWQWGRVAGSVCAKVPWVWGIASVLLALNTCSSPCWPMEWRKRGKPVPLVREVRLVTSYPSLLSSFQNIRCKFLNIQTASCSILVVWPSKSIYSTFKRLLPVVYKIFFISRSKYKLLEKSPIPPWFLFLLASQIYVILAFYLVNPIFRAYFEINSLTAFFSLL